MELVDNEIAENEWRGIFQFPNQDRNFAYGFEAGQIFERLKVKPPHIGSLEEPLVLMDVNIETYKGMSDTMGYEFNCWPSEVEGWQYATFTMKPKLVLKSVK